MNIFEIRERTGIALRTLQKLDEIGALDHDPVDPIVSDIYTNLGKRVPLTVAQLLALIEQPALLTSLGKHQDDAQFEIEDLGNYVAEAAPQKVYFQLGDAAYNDDQAIRKIVAWIKSIIPPHYPVRHSYIAIRLVTGSTQPEMRKHYLKIIGRALGYCRAHPEFNGWWKVEAGKGKRVTWYSQPQISYDL